MSRKVIGILGGMGPAATVDLFGKITAATVAASDQEHLHVIIDSNTNIPDRTAALLHGGESPVPELTASARRLAAAGAELIVMACNTAHGFYDEVSRAAGVPVLHMIRLTAQELHAHGIKRAGLLATDGTVETGLYDKALADSGIELLKPSKSGQAAVMELIYGGMKSGRRDFDPGEFCRVCEELLYRGAETLILGCTELPPAFEHYALSYPHLDPTLVLAHAAVNAACGKSQAPLH